MGCPGEKGQGCPIGHQDPRSMMDAGVGGKGDDVGRLSGMRISSSIPRAGPADLSTPSASNPHTPTASSTPPTPSSNWLYPSPQMFYNAMQRKGHAARPEDMEVIVTIHNMVNEQTWQSILRWERYYHSQGQRGDPCDPNQQVRLKRFLGRPDDLSPKAWIKSCLLGYTRPFDRHDWYVERPDGREARYVIDFYAGRAPAGDSAPPLPSFYIDARPALDSPEACWERFHCASQKLWASVQRFFNDGSSNNSDSGSGNRNES